ncbi:MAG TPA: hypothetical protein VGL81_26925 [Polyangiaceae bacterium]
MASRTSAIPALLLVLSLAATASAQPTAADRETARALMDDGDRKAEAHDDAGALRSYRAADEMMHVPSTAIEVVKTLARMGQLVEARDQALALLRLPRTEPEPTPFVAARAEAERLAASLAVRIPTLSLHVTGLAAGEVPTVRVDGELVPPDALPLPRRADPGVHHIVASAPGRADVLRDVQLAEGHAAPVELSFGPVIGVVPPPAPVVAPAPLPAIPLESAPAPASSSPGAATWAALGVGAAGLVVGTIAGILELSKASAVKGQCHGNACPESERGELSDANTLANVSNIGLGVGVAGAAVGAVLYFIAPRAPVQPSVGVLRGGGSVGVGGSF